MLIWLAEYAAAAAATAAAWLQVTCPQQHVITAQPV
jgi:hypothetical protein